MSQQNHAAKTAVSTPPIGSPRLDTIKSQRSKMVLLKTLISDKTPKERVHGTESTVMKTKQIITAFTLPIFNSWTIQVISISSMETALVKAATIRQTKNATEKR